MTTMTRADAELVRWMQRTKCRGRVAKEWLGLPYVELDEGHMDALFGPSRPAALPWPQAPYILPWPAGIISAAVPLRDDPLKRVWWRYRELGERVEVVIAQEGAVYQGFGIAPLGYIEREPFLHLGVHHRYNEPPNVRWRARKILHLGALAAQSLLQKDKDNE